MDKRILKTLSGWGLEYFELREMMNAEAEFGVARSKDGHVLSYVLSMSAEKKEQKMWNDAMGIFVEKEINMWRCDLVVFVNQEALEQWEKEQELHEHMFYHSKNKAVI